MDEETKIKITRLLEADWASFCNKVVELKIDISPSQLASMWTQLGVLVIVARVKALEVAREPLKAKLCEIVDESFEKVRSTVSNFKTKINPNSSLKAIKSTNET